MIGASSASTDDDRFARFTGRRTAAFALVFFACDGFAFFDLLAMPGVVAQNGPPDESADFVVLIESGPLAIHLPNGPVSIQFMKRARPPFQSGDVAGQTSTSTLVWRRID